MIKSFTQIFPQYIPERTGSKTENGNGQGASKGVVTHQNFINSNPSGMNYSGANSSGNNSAFNGSTNHTVNNYSGSNSAFNGSTESNKPRARLFSEILKNDGGSLSVENNNGREITTTSPPYKKEFQSPKQIEVVEYPQNHNSPDMKTTTPSLLKKENTHTKEKKLFS